MKQVLQIRCKNNKKTQEVPMGSTLSDIYKEINLQLPYEPVSAKVNNKVEGLHYRVYHNKDIEFLDLRSPSGIRTYTRSLFMVLCKAVHDLYAGSKVVIDIPVSNGYYCNIKLGRPITTEDIDRIRTRMQEIINAKMPIQRFETTTEDAIKIFTALGDEQKAKLLRSSGSLYSVYYILDDYKDYYYGSMLTNTSQLRLFGLEPYFDGILLRIPSTQDPTKLGELVRQDKMFEVFKEHHRWQSILGIRTVGDFNEGVLLASGVKPVQISLDDYFVNRHDTPKDENGELDYESIYALNIPLINEQFNALFRGEEVELPKYNFQTGTSEKSGKKLRLEENNVLVVEGIHALNPLLTEQIANEKKFKIYASALTTILLDNHNYIPTTDNRLLRRIVRDYKYRGCSAEETIHRWPSVRAGENKWIFPYQEQADVMFNTAMLFELAVIKPQAEEVLEQVPENCEEYAEAYRLRKFLKYFAPLPFRDLPPTSLLREFLGGSSFKY